MAFLMRAVGISSSLAVTSMLEAGRVIPVRKKTPIPGASLFLAFLMWWAYCNCWLNNKERNTNVIG